MAVQEILPLVNEKLNELMSSFLLSRHSKFGNQFVTFWMYFQPAGNDVAFKSYFKKNFWIIPQIYSHLHQHNSENTQLSNVDKREFLLQLFSFFPLHATKLMTENLLKVLESLKYWF